MSVYDIALKFTLQEGVIAQGKGFLKQMCIICKPKAGATAGKYLITSEQELTAQTDNTSGLAIFRGGLSNFYLITTDDITTVGSLLVEGENDFYTAVVTEDFTDAEKVTVEDINFKGNVFTITSDVAVAEAFIQGYDKRGVYISIDSKALLFSLSSIFNTTVGINYNDGQYLNQGADGIGGVDNDGVAENYFNKRLSFGYSDKTAGNLLAGLFVGKKAFSYRYVYKSLEIDLQNAGLNYIAVQRPKNTKAGRHQIKVIFRPIFNNYINNSLIGSNYILNISGSNENFIVDGAIELVVVEPIWKFAILTKVSN